jgi:hypothetical protein
MKKIFAYIIIAAAVAPVFSSCKKGENDPFISFRSRKARVAGEWKVTSGKGSQVETGSNAYNYSWTFDGTTYSETGNFGTSSVPRTIEYTFDKDGKFTYDETMGGDTYKSTGTWNFMEGVGETKSKSQLVLREETYTSPSSSSNYEGSTAYDGGFEIVELRHKKMVLRVKYDYSFSSGGTGQVEEEFVLEAK